MSAPTPAMELTYRDGVILRGPTPNGFRVVVTGGRDYQDRAAVETVLKAIRPSRVAHGACDEWDSVRRARVLRGADRWADEIGRELGAVVQGYPADWKMNRLAAGPIRNGRMLRAERPDLVIAFPGGTGTADCVRQADRLRIPVLPVPFREGKVDLPALCWWFEEPERQQGKAAR